jgi:hypothetical protein
MSSGPKTSKEGAKRPAKKPDKQEKELQKPSDSKEKSRERSPARSEIVISFKIELNRGDSVPRTRCTKVLEGELRI